MAGDNKRIIRAARKMNPHIHIIIRTRFLRDMKDLFDLGADEVIPEEFETSVEIFTRVLTKYLVPHKEIEKLVAEVRSDGYQMFRSLSTSEIQTPHLAVNVPQVEIQSLHVCHNSYAAGKPLGELNVSKIDGLTLLAISRGNEVFSKPDKNLVLRENDVLFFLGQTSKLNPIMEMFREEGSGK
jgi:CPA2 family monovalent cation:H+ antiporter-2